VTKRVTLQVRKRCWLDSFNSLHKIHRL